jgi:hypothetical protein
LRCLRFNFSKFGDWYLYALHDSAYLASKGQSRHYHYAYNDLKTSDNDELYRSSKEIDLRLVAPLKGLEQAINDGLTFQQALKSGIIPLPQIRNYQMAWELLTNQGTYRAGHYGHEVPPNFDPETGEILK